LGSITTGTSPPPSNRSSAPTPSQQPRRRALALRLAAPLLSRDDEALAELRRAEDADPLTPLCPAFTASGAAWVWRLEEAQLAISRFLALNSDLPIGQLVHGDLLAQTGRFDEAVAAMRRAAAGNATWRWGLGYALAQAGQPEEARRIADDLRRNPTGLNAWGLAQVYTALGERDKAFRWLEAAYRARWNWMPWMDFDPVFVPPRGDPRFEELLRRVGALHCGVCPTARPGG
jgi:tetratricopeptide (TPR) repeat protein